MMCRHRRANQHTGLAVARLTSGHGAVSCCAVQHRANRPGRSRLLRGLRRGRGSPAVPSCCQVRNTEAGRAAVPAGRGGWTRKGSGHPVDNGMRARCRRDVFRSEGMSGPSSALRCAPARVSGGPGAGVNAGGMPGRLLPERVTGSESSPRAWPDAMQATGSVPAWKPEFGGSRRNTPDRAKTSRGQAA